MSCSNVSFLVGRFVESVSIWLLFVVICCLNTSPVLNEIVIINHLTILLGSCLAPLRFTIASVLEPLGLSSMKKTQYTPLAVVQHDYLLFTYLPRYVLVMRLGESRKIRQGFNKYTYAIKSCKSWLCLPIIVVCVIIREIYWLLIFCKRT